MCGFKIIIFIFSFIIVNVFGGLRIDPLVNTKLGLIRGLRASDGDYSMFMGIPFATVRKDKPFSEAIPQEPFDDIFEAYDDSAICPQIEEFNRTVTGTLDCLHLNIYVPNSASTQNRLPVLAFIYGGSFRVGFAGRYLYGPKYFVRHDVILVTINYRTGPYGFMCLDTPDVPGNQGFKDQLLALRWIKDNIEAFGGDSNRITLGGRSAGGIAVDFHLLSPHEKLYNNIIIQSGTSLSPTFHEPVKNAPLLLAAHLGFETDNIDDAVSYLANLDTNSVILAVNALSDLDFRPCVEREFSNVDAFIPQNWISAAVPKVKNMSVLIGFNNHEFLNTYIRQSVFNENILTDKLAQAFETDNEAFDGMYELGRQFYIGDEPVSDKFRFEIIDYVSDVHYNHPTFRTIKRYLENGADKIFNYLFSYVGGRNYMRYRRNITVGGVTHSDEIGYFFDVSFMSQNPITEQDQRVIDQMTTMWANFVKYSDPTPELSEILTTKWTPITQGSLHHTLDIDSELRSISRPFNQRMTFWDLFYKTNHDLQRIYPGETIV